ncbi:MAG: response regulator [Saprospiraceae bacterium]|nr:response regulator [Saprospiraceae bacterium]
MSVERINNHILLGRIYLLLGGLGMPAFTGLNHWIGSGVFETTWESWMFGLICLLLFAITLRKDLSTERRFQVFDFGFFYFTFAGFYIDYIGGFASQYLITQMILIQFTFMVLRWHRQLIIYSLFIFACVIGFLALSVQLPIAYKVFIASSFVIISVGNYFVWSRRLAEQDQNQHIKALMNGILEVAQDGIIAVESKRSPNGTIRDFEITHVNGAFYDLFPFLKNKQVKWVKELIPRRYGSQVFNQFIDVVEKGRSFELSDQFQGLNGEPLWLKLVAAKLEDGLTITFTDVTKQKIYEAQLEEAKEKAEEGARAKSSFLATMSHEIRTPMNGIIGMIDLMYNTELSVEQLEHLDIIRTSSESLLTIINDILDFSKIESGKLELEERNFSLRACLEDTLDLLGKRARDKELDLFYYMEPEVPEYIAGDVVRLGQILTNLVSNAIKFTETGEIYVHVKRVDQGWAAPGDHVHLHFSVRDTGIGIPSDKIGQLFQAFNQVDTSTTRKYGGTGLGLVICQRLCQLMHGKIWVESEFGKGSQFQFIISCKLSPMTYVQEQDQPRIVEDLRGKRILLIDDNETNLMILAAFITRMGLKPTVAKSPVKALEMVNKQIFDLVITDYNMPIMNGLQMASAIKKQMTCPILLLSSSQELPMKEVSKWVDSYQFKPIRERQLQLLMVKLFNSPTKLNTSVRKQRAKTFREDLAEDIPLRILLAEDFIVNQKIASRIFKKMGYEIDIAENGLEAVEKSSKFTYDIIFMDVQMPEMDGLQATQEIKSSMQADSPVIIAMTANAMPEDRQKCIDAGMDDYLSKPFKPAELQKLLVKYNPRTYQPE